MAAMRLRSLSVLIAAMSLSGCGLLCDRYCERQQDRCRQYCQPGCTPVSHFGPTPVASNTYPRPIDPCQPVNYCP